MWILIRKYHVESLTFHCPKNLLQVNNKKKRKTFIKLALVPVLLTLNRYLHTDNKSSCSKLIMLTWWKCQLMSFSDMYLGYCQTSIVKLFSFFAKVVNGITDEMPDTVPNTPVFDEIWIRFQVLMFKLLTSNMLYSIVELTPLKRHTESQLTLFQVI